MKMRKILGLLFALFANKFLFSQDNLNKFSFYMDYNFSKSLTTNPIKPNYFVSYYDNDYLNINNITLQYSRNENFNDGKFRFKFGLITGSYAYYNMINEPEGLKAFYESNVGYKLNKHWMIEYGLMSSHIGFESAMGIESHTATRSILADNSPYYENGFRLTYQSKNKKLMANLNMLDGWQMIVPKYNNQRRAWGHQAQFKPNKNITFNSSSYLGPSPTNFPKTRYFHNFYTQIKTDNDWEFTLGFDNAMEAKENTFTQEDEYYFAPIAIVKYSFDQELSITGRYEYFEDNNMILKYLELKSVHGLSINLDYKLDDEMLFRIEGRMLKHREYPSLNQNDRVNAFVSGIICMKFTK